MCAVALFAWHSCNYELNFKEFPTLSIIFFLFLLQYFIFCTVSIFSHFVSVHVDGSDRSDFTESKSPLNTIRRVCKLCWNHAESTQEGHKIKLDYKLEFHISCRSFFLSFVRSFAHLSPFYLVHWTEMNVIRIFCTLILLRLDALKWQPEQYSLISISIVFCRIVAKW